MKKTILNLRQKNGTFSMITQKLIMIQQIKLAIIQKF